MPGCSLDTLGAFALRVDGRPAPSPSTQKARALLAYLVMHRGKDVARERLLDLFWPDVDPDRARDSLRTALYSIRRSVRTAGVDSDALLSSNKSIVRWNPETLLDVDRFVELTEDGAGDSLSEALALYRGDFLEGDYDNWTVVERERLAALYEGSLARALAARSQPAIANKLLERNPYEEAAYAALIDGALAEGRRLAAVALLRQCRAAFSEIDTDPSPEFVRRFAHLEHAAPVPSQAPRLAYAGRETLSIELRGIIARAAADSSGAIVVASGEPGIGKSAFLEHAADVAHDAGLRVLRIGFLAHDPRPFGAWGPLFESLTSLSFDAFVKSSTGRVAEAIASAQLAALKAPSALLADDAQYLNDESLGLLGAAANLAARAGHVVLIATRPEGFERLGGELDDALRHDLQVERLTRDQLEEALVAAGFAGAATLAQTLFRRTAGNPMFSESLLDAFVKDGGLRREGRRWVLAETADAEITLPKTLTRSIESRLRSRGPSAAAIAAALALEPEATADDLQAVLEMDETLVLDALDDLLSLGVIVQPSSGPQFAFSHDLVREQAALLLNAARRVRVHRGFAVRLENSDAADASLRRARHLEAAREPMPAAEAYLTAALQAMELNATQEALDRAQRGRSLLEHLQANPVVDHLVARTYEAMGRTLRRASMFEESFARMNDMVRHARAAGDLRLLLLALARCTSVQTELGTIGRSVHAKELLAVASQLGDDRSLAIAHAQISFGHLWERDERGTIEEGEAAIAAAKRCGDRRIMSVVADALQRAQAAWWHFADAAKTLATMQENASGLGWVLEGNVSSWRGHFYYYAGQLADAERELDAARRITTQRTGARADDGDIGVAGISYLVEGFSALVAIERGDFEVALRYESIRQRFPAVGRQFYENYGLMVPIDALLLRDGPGDGERASTMLGQLSELYYGPWLSSHLIPDVMRARVAARLHEPGAARLVRAALDGVERSAARCPGDCYRAFDRLATAAADAGDVETAAHAVDLRDRWMIRHAAAVAPLLAASKL
jgi:DNA-binding SARP family transcriptional activator